MALWGGRFETGPDALFSEYNDSLRFDFRLAIQDITGSIGWARALQRAGVLSAQELAQLVSALEDLLRLVRSDPSAPLQGPPAEDVHSWVESQLIARVGALGKKLHTGRSRNDQVATDLRLWTRTEIEARVTEILAARSSLINFANREHGTVISGYTHLQRAQPVLLSHWALAYAEMLLRDAGRFRDALARVNVCPLGSGALAGTAYPVDRTLLATELGFSGPSANSLDAVSDRDFVVETLSAAALTAAHLSRLGEDVILYASQEFAYFELDDTVASGSSLMPQKKNPDAAELLRGKAGRIFGSLQALLTTIKGLPLAYNKDLQEDKEPLFDAMDHLSLSLRMVPRILDTMKVRREVCRRAAQGGYSNATDLADYLVAKGVPFREAHETVGAIVRLAIQRGAAIEELSLDELKRLAPQIGADVFERITIDRGLASREVLGGTGPQHVKAAIQAAMRGS